MLDWMTGDPNSKYYVTQLLASTVGAAVEKALFASTVTVATGASGASTRSASAIANETVYVLPFQFTASAAKGLLLVNKKAAEINVTIAPAFAGLSSSSAAPPVATVVEVAMGFAGGASFQPPQRRELTEAGGLPLGPFAVAVVLEPSRKLEPGGRRTLQNSSLQS